MISPQDKIFLVKFEQVYKYFQIYEPFNSFVLRMYGLFIF